MKNRNSMIYVCAAVCACCIFNGCAKTQEDAQNTTDLPFSVFAEIDIEDNYANSEDIQVFANYTDGSQNFADLMEEANYIVKAPVTSTSKKSAVTQTSTLAVTEAYKGNVSGEITLYQMAGDNNVLSGTEYILFMNKQYPNDSASNVFYSCGGGQGVMRMDSESKKIFVNSEILLGQDISDWLGDHLEDYIAVAEGFEEN